LVSGVFTNDVRGRVIGRWQPLTTVPNVFEVVPAAEIPIVMESSATPVMVALPVTTLPPSITIVMASFFAPLVPIATSFLPLPVAMAIAPPIEIPMRA
jgi:hypothetical protein